MRSLPESSWGMEQDCDQAIDQIMKEKYAEGLYGYTQILCYGIFFSRSKPG